MKMSSSLTRKIIAMLSVTIILFATLQVSGQDTHDFQSRIAYERRLDDDTTEVVYYEDGVKNIFPISATECYKVFTENREVKSRFLAVTQDENPTSLTVYDLLTKEIVFQRDWDSSWGRCSFEWIDGHMSVWLLDNEADYSDYNILDEEGNIVDTVRIDRRSRWDELEAQLTLWIPDYPSGNGWYDHDYPFWISQYSPYIIISPYLDENHNIKDCCGLRQTVILDVDKGEIVEILENAPILDPSPRFPSGVHLQDFEFSYDGNYLFYVSRTFSVYDIVSDEYLVQIDLPSGYSSSDISRYIIWSPNEKYVAFTLFEEGHYEKYVGAVNIARNELYISSLLYEVETTLQIRDNLSTSYNYTWLSEQFQLAWVNPEQELIIYDIETDTTSVLDDNVIWIIGS